MSDEPLVSIVTPTIPGREKVLFNRCVPSVMRQSWKGNIEHIIVSDRNPKFDWTHNYKVGNYRMRSIQINEAWRNGILDQSNGAFPWMIGSYLALGEFVGFLGDDDEYLPEHIETHVQAMRDANAVWSLSQVEFWGNGVYHTTIGDDSYLEAHLDATGIMCWKDALKHATWETNSGIQAVDWLLVDRWRSAGLPGTFIDKPTGIHHDGWLTGFTGKPYEG